MNRRLRKLYLPIVLTFILSVFFTGESIAAFPCGRSGTTVTIPTKEHKSFTKVKAIKRALINRYRDRGNEGSGAFGILSFVFSMIGLIMLVATFAAPVLVIAALLFGIAGTIFGAISMSRKNDGFGIAGLVLGILDITVALIFAAIIIIFISLF